ncbi:MAG: YebC/PmpR family DNA-binding transcriptional regulator [Patescibacteria group bacterium]
MSGHSHWSKIKHKKGASDVIRGNTFSKMAQAIAIAAKDGGDPDMNPKLRMAIEKAKEINLPKENVERAIKKGCGEIEGIQLQELSFEAFGPGGIAIMVEGISDNKNRSLGEIKQALNKHNGKLAGEGSVKWLFERRGILAVDYQPEQDKEDFELKAIESGAENFSWYEDSLEIHTKIDDLEIVKNNLEKQELKVTSASLGWIAKEEIEIGEKDKEAANRLFEALDDTEFAQEIYSNLKN